MQSVINSEPEDLKLQAAKVRQLQTSLQRAQEECSSLRECYRHIKEDFRFNLAILDERDRELERYDAVTARALALHDNRQDEVRRLRLQVSHLEQERNREAEQWQEELRQSQHSTAQCRKEMEELKVSMAVKIQKQTEEYEKKMLDLQGKIQDLQEELIQQRQELTAAFDQELQQREHDFKMKMDEMRAVVLSHDLKVKLLSREVEVHSQAQLQTSEALESTQDFCRQIQTQLQHKEQEIRDLTAVKDYRVKDLEEELKLMEAKLKRGEDDHLKKYLDMTQALSECEAQLEAQHQKHTEQLWTAEKHIVKLQEDMRAQVSQTHSLKREQQEAMKQKEETIHKLGTEVKRIQSRWDQYVSKVSCEMVLKDTEMIALQERETKLKHELEKSREEMERYKQQLSADLKREQAFEQKRVQVELEWQRRCEDMKAELYLANEQLIQDLSQARDQAKAELKEKEQELQELTVLLCSIKTERDQALTQGLMPKVDYLASEEISHLQEQNGVLRAVVNQMRKDMEGLSHLQLQTQPQTYPPHLLGPPPATDDIHITSKSQTQSTETSSKVKPTAADYTAAVEQEVSRLKAQCRTLKEQLEGTTGSLNQGPPADKPSQGSFVPQSAHMKQYGPEQGERFLEKCANTSSLKKQEVKVSQGEPAPISIVQQTALIQQLQDENLRLCQQQQQQASALLSGGVFDKIDRSLLRTRLKQAALCISRLSVEKQQLIKMGNRLRAQITAAGLQEAAEPQQDTHAETPEDQPGRLSALEQLQYQPTTQELQYALRQRAYTPAEQPHPETDSRVSVTKSTANSWTQGSKTRERPELHPAASSSLLSPEESLRSLKELWDKLDQGLSPTIFSEGELSRTAGVESAAAGVQMMMKCISAPIHVQKITEGKQRRNPSACTSNKSRQKAGATGGIGKIRNYNIKD